MASSIVTVDPPVIRAAGGIVQRSNGAGDEVMIVHRKRYQDWTLPKGKVKEGESFQEAALREVEEETGFSCELGNYLGTISYAVNGIPKVVLFWKMSPVEEKGVADSEEISEALWMQVPAAVERLSHPQEKALLSRVTPSRQVQPEPARPAASEVVPIRRKPLRAEDERAAGRLLREAEAFRLELAFLERRSELPDKSWAMAARDQLDNVKRCLDEHDLEGGWFCLHAAQRYAAHGLNRAELSNRACILREEAQQIRSWRGALIETLLGVSEEQLTAERVAHAVAVRDEELDRQREETRQAGDRLRILLFICAVAVVAFLPFMLLSGPTRLLAPVLLFGLLGSSFCAAHSLIRGKRPVPNLYVMLGQVLFGAVAGLASYPIYEYAVSRFESIPLHTSALLALAFLLGCIGKVVLGRNTGASPARKKRS